MVEDNDSYRQIVVLTLKQRLPGYRIVEAASVQEALEAGEAGHIDVAILDMTLPDGMATDILLAWKSRLAEGLKAIVFSNYDADEAAPELMKLGAHGYVNKEHGLKPLVQAVQTAATQPVGSLP